MNDDSENKYNVKPIAINGNAMMKVVPDYIMLIHNLHVTGRKQEDITQIIEQQICQLKEKLGLAGIGEADIRFSGVTIDVGNMAPGNSEQGEYIAKSTLELNIEFNRNQLVQVIRGVSECAPVSEGSIYFTLKDLAAVKEELFRLAKERSQKNHENLCRFFRVTPGPLQKVEIDNESFIAYTKIDYVIDENSVISPSIMNITDSIPREIEASAEWKFIWEMHVYEWQIREMEKHRRER